MASNNSSLDSSDFVESSPEKALSSSIWCEKLIATRHNVLQNNSKDSEENYGKDETNCSISYKSQDEIKKSLSTMKIIETPISIHSTPEPHILDFNSEEDVDIIEDKATKASGNVKWNKLASDSDSDIDTHRTWRKKAVIESDSESDYENYTVSSSDSEIENTGASINLGKHKDKKKLTETSSSKEISRLEGQLDNKMISQETSDDAVVLDVSVSVGSSERFADGETDRKSFPKVEQNDHKAADIRGTKIDSSDECIYIDDSPVKKCGLDVLSKPSKVDEAKTLSSNRIVDQLLAKSSTSIKVAEIGSSSLVSSMIKSTGVQQPDGKEKATKEYFMKQNEHTLPVYALGKKMENVTLSEKSESFSSEHKRKEHLKLIIREATEKVARLKKTVKNANMDILPDRGLKLRTNLFEEEALLMKLNKEFNTLKYDEKKDKKVIPNPFQVVGNTIARETSDSEGNKRVVPNPFQIARNAIAQPPSNSGNESKPAPNWGKMPTTFGMGERALATYRGEKAMTMDTLKELHKSMESCPREDTFEEDPKLLRSDVTLMPHQKRALAWLLWREANKPYGGILADDMGLGKTLTMISLVLKVKELKKEDEDKHDSETDEENGTSWYSSKKKWVKGGTLVVCPASLINQWANEVKNRCKIGALDVEVFHGSSRETKPKRLARRDMVITTYSLVRSEGAVITGKRGAADSYEYSRQGPLFGVKWERVILDEAHQIRNHKSQSSIAACGLRAKYRWVLTGTPMHNKDLDLYALLKFLKCSPFDDISIWRHWIGNKSAGGLQRLNMVINSLMLRRTKDQLQSKGALGSLSEKHMHQITVTLDKEEFEVYDTVLSLSKSVFQIFLDQRAEKAAQQWETNKKNLHHECPQNLYELSDELQALHQRLNNMQDVKTFEILVLLLRLRQICCHPGLIQSMLDEESCKNDSIQDEDGVDIDLMSKLSKLGLDDQENEKPGIEDQNEDSNVIKKKVLVSSNPVFDMNRISSKMRILFKMLEEKVLSSGDNAVIVSQWTTLLDIIKVHLESFGTKCLLLSGAVAVKDRMALVDAFNAPSKKSIVMLLSLTAGGVGLNLIGGNHLFLFDIHWNPQLEAQAFDRIYRVGQTKTVHIYKFICDDTIEQRILALQTKKLAIADNILTGARNQQASKLTLDDLKMLFNIHAS